MRGGSGPREPRRRVLPEVGGPRGRSVAVAASGGRPHVGEVRRLRDVPALGRQSLLRTLFHQADGSRQELGRRAFFQQFGPSLGEAPRPQRSPRHQHRKYSLYASADRTSDALSKCKGVFLSILADPGLMPNSSSVTGRPISVRQERPVSTGKPRGN